MVGAVEDQMKSGTEARTSGVGGVGLGETAHMQVFWRPDVVLELWVDVDQEPVVIRLAGTLDDATGANLVAVVEELMADGCRAFELQAPELLVSHHGGVELLADLQRAVASSGGRLVLDPSVLVD